MSLQLDLNTLIGGALLLMFSFTMRILHKLYGDMQTVKSVLGVNGNPTTGLVHEVGKLREAKHTHANRIVELTERVDDLNDWRNRQ